MTVSMIFSSVSIQPVVLYEFLVGIFITAKTAVASMPLCIAIALTSMEKLSSSNHLKDPWKGIHHRRRTCAFGSHNQPSAVAARIASARR